MIYSHTEDFALPDILVLFLPMYSLFYILFSIFKDNLFLKFYDPIRKI